MRNLFFFITCCFPLMLRAQQTTLHGVITVLNSRFEKGQTEYVQDAEIRETSGQGNAPVRSGSDGRFSIDLTGNRENEPVFIKVSKAGYWLVNDANLQILPGRKDTVHLFMATGHYLAAAKQRYYDIAYTAAQKNLLQLYDGKKKTLETLQGQADANAEQIQSLRDDLFGVHKQFEKLDPLASYFAGKYESLNLDGASPLFLDAFRLFQAGNPDSALHLLRRSNLVALLERETSGIKSGGKKDPQNAPFAPVAGLTRRETVRILNFKADLHRIRNEWDSLDKCYEQLLLLDNNDPGIYRNFAVFLMDRNKPEAARAHFEKCLSLVVTATDSAVQYLRLGDVYLTLEQPVEAEQMTRLALALSERLAAFNPDQYDPQLASACFYMGEFYRGMHRTTEAETMYLRALELDKRLFELYPELFEPDLVRDYSLLGIVYAEANRAAESETFLLRSREKLERLVETDPIRFERLLAFVEASLGWTYAASQKVVESEKMYLQALQRLERLAQNTPPQFEQYLAETAGYLGELYYNVQNIPEAEKMCQRALEIWERLTQFLGPERFGPELARTALNLGQCYSVSGKMNKAEKMYIQALEIRERLAQRDSLRFGPDLALTASRLGAFYFNLQKLPESEKMLSLALTMWEHLAQNDPVTFEPELAKTGLILGDVLLYLQKLPESEKTLLHALEIQDRLAQKDPIQFGPTLARTQNDLGFLYHQSGNMPESERRLMRALEIYEHMAQSDPAQFEPELAGTALNLSALRMQNGQLEDAAALGSRALALRKKALVARQTNSWDEFNRAYTFTAALRDSLATHRSYPAAVALQQMRAECTDTLWELDIKILSKAAGDFGNLSWQYLFNGQYAQAEQAAKKALELDDSQHWVKTNLGHSYLLRGNLKKAKQVYREYMDDDGPKAKSMLLKDLDALEAGGVKHGDIGKVRKWLEGL